MDNADAIEQAKVALQIWVDLSHRELNYWEILRILLDTAPEVQRQADNEFWLKVRR